MTVSGIHFFKCLLFLDQDTLQCTIVLQPPYTSTTTSGRRIYRLISHVAAVVDVAETLSVGEVTRAFVDTVIKGIHWKDVTQVLFINSYTSHIKFVNQNLTWKMVFQQFKYSSCFEPNKVYHKAHFKFGNTTLMKFFEK